MSTPTAPTPKGLAGVVAGETAICTVGDHSLGLLYRGYKIEELAKNALFEEVAYLLLYGTLPTRKQLTAYIAQLAALRRLPGKLCDLLELLPASTHPMDVLRTGVSFLASLEPEEKHGALYVANRLIATFGSMLLYWHHFQTSGQRIDTAAADATQTTAEHFLSLLHNNALKPDPRHVSALNVSFILYAEHDLAASTFAARVTASTLSDLYSSICTAIGTLRGPLHGGANEAAHALITSYSTPEDAEKGVLELLAKKQLIMGFGHRIYRDGDPRTPIIKSTAIQLSEQPVDTSARHPFSETSVSTAGTYKPLLAVAERLEEVMKREKKLHPNLDFYTAIVYHQLGIPRPFFTPLFVIARTSGWAAHILEQRKDNRLIRPVSRYVGSGPRPWVELDERQEK